ncbi:MAG: hypothetical protein IRY95_00515, partial [Clostridia bacterium]|nr:hypothetical protein [Clostridia bacterium]
MRAMPRLLAVAVVVALLAASAATLVPRWVRPRWQVGPEVPAIDPRARVLPDRTYDLRAWVFRWPEPPRQPPRDGAERPPAAAAQAWVAGVLEGFRREHANVRVTVEWLPLSAAPERLRTAVEEGAPPDVAVPPPGAVLLYQRGAQLPADPWLGRSEAEWYEPAAWRGLAAGGWHWGWPAWVAPRLWA